MRPLTSSRLKVQYPSQIVDDPHCSFGLTLDTQCWLWAARDTSNEVGTHIALSDSDRNGVNPVIEIHNWESPRLTMKYLRCLLTECANFILGRFGKDGSLRRWWFPEHKARWHSHKRRLNSTFYKNYTQRARNRRNEGLSPHLLGRFLRKYDPQQIISNLPDVQLEAMNDRYL
jgi:hypothetical protein